MEFDILKQLAWPGVALFFAGISLRWLAIAYLGRFFTVEVAIESGHKIVDHGPYRYLRHPSYTGLLLMFLGMGICSANALSLLLVLLPVFLALRYRIRIEETVLQDAFGKTYADYAQKTWRMIPFIY
ncbi:methyltransferase family protein [Undibacterium sp. JH2W]|uniref:methyltransferase family protein n=1 Tax=Undibacterium sp. JH2W TaxID=3413037 RepID=UPI003BF0C7AA